MLCSALSSPGFLKPLNSVESTRMPLESLAFEIKQALETGEILAEYSYSGIDGSIANDTISECGMTKESKSHICFEAWKATMPRLVGKGNLRIHALFFSRLETTSRCSSGPC